MEPRAALQALKARLQGRLVEFGEGWVAWGGPALQAGVTLPCMTRSEPSDHRTSAQNITYYVHRIAYMIDRSTLGAVRG